MVQPTYATSIPQPTQHPLQAAQNNLWVTPPTPSVPSSTLQAAAPMTSTLQAATAPSPFTMPPLFNAYPAPSTLQAPQPTTLQAPLATTLQAPQPTTLQAPLATTLQAAQPTTLQATVAPSTSTQPAPLNFIEEVRQLAGSSYQATIHNTLQELVGEVKQFSHNCLRQGTHTHATALAQLIVLLTGTLTPKSKLVTELWNQANLNPQQQADYQKQREFVARKIQLMKDTSYMIVATKAGAPVQGMDPVHTVDPIVTDLFRKATELNGVVQKTTQFMREAPFIATYLQEAHPEQQLIQARDIQNERSAFLAKQTPRIQFKIEKFSAFAAAYESQIPSNDVTKQKIAEVRGLLGSIQQSAPRGNREVDVLSGALNSLRVGSQAPTVATVQQPVLPLQQTGAPTNYTIQDVRNCLGSFAQAVHGKNREQISITFNTLLRMPLRNELRLNPEESTLAHSLGNLIWVLGGGVDPSAATALDLFLSENSTLHNTKLRVINDTLEKMKANTLWAA